MADDIARVVSDLRAGRVRVPKASGPVSQAALRAARTTGPVVDATGIYTALVQQDKPVDVYGDHPCIAPPWESAAVCYRNEHGNVIVMHSQSAEVDGGLDPEVLERSGWVAANPTDWGRVRWVIDTFIWVGGRSTRSGPFPTSGPMHLWRSAVYGDGEPADLHWVQLMPDYPMERWDMAQLVFLGSLNFLACRNVELVEPQRTRAEARRIARTGVTVSEINVFPVGKTTRSASGEPVGGTAVSPVRGHFSHYGERYGKGLLFGKYEGKFWIPQHVRGANGDADDPDDRRYRLHPRQAEQDEGAT